MMQPAADQPVVLPPAVAVPGRCRTMGPLHDIVVGTEGDDDLVGTPGNDLILGLGGNDCIVGGAGRDRLIGGHRGDHVDSPGATYIIVPLQLA